MTITSSFQLAKSEERCPEQHGRSLRARFSSGRWSMPRVLQEAGTQTTGRPLGIVAFTLMLISSRGLRDD